MSRFLPATIEIIALAMLPGIFMTPREVELRLPLSISRGTVRAILRDFVTEGRALGQGDVTQRRYRLIAGGASQMTTLMNQPAPIGAASRERPTDGD